MNLFNRYFNIVSAPSVSRTEFWFTYVVVAFVAFACADIMTVLSAIAVETQSDLTFEFITIGSWISSFVLVWFYVVLIARRCADALFSKWWTVVMLTPLVGFSVFWYITLHPTRKTKDEVVNTVPSIVMATLSILLALLNFGFVIFG